MNLLSRALSRGERKPQPRRKRVNLALQGGGAHGAFTWGVLDHLLEDGRLEIEGISGTSAGALNAVMLADGLARGGAKEAQKRLADFWQAASIDGKLPKIQRMILDRLLSVLPYEGTPMQAWFDAMSQFYSPYDFNPLRINPLKDLIEKFVDFDTLRDADSLKLFISATNVHTGRLRVFPRAQVSADVVMASACLPFLFRAVEVDGAPYWDGGYMGNPAIFPLFTDMQSEDVLVVQINPVVRHSVPQSATEIMNRVNEITFNSSLLGEYRAIEFVSRLIDQGRLPHGTGPGEYRRIKLHRIALDEVFKNLTNSTKLNSDYDFFVTMRDGGRRAARNFLDAHFADIGARSTFDLAAEAAVERA